MLVSKRFLDHDTVLHMILYSVGGTKFDSSQGSTSSHVIPNHQPMDLAVASHRGEDTGIRLGAERCSSANVFINQWPVMSKSKASDVISIDQLPTTYCSIKPLHISINQLVFASELIRLPLAHAELSHWLIKPQITNFLLQKNAQT